MISRKSLARGFMLHFGEENEKPSKHKYWDTRLLRHRGFTDLNLSSVGGFQKKKVFEKG